jgi:hypothetical protein
MIAGVGERTIGCLAKAGNLLARVSESDLLDSTGVAD